MIFRVNVWGHYILRYLIKESNEIWDFSTLCSSSPNPGMIKSGFSSLPKTTYCEAFALAPNTSMDPLYYFDIPLNSPFPQEKGTDSYSR
jgi:hypothetical protein